MGGCCSAGGAVGSQLESARNTNGLVLRGKNIRSVPAAAFDITTLVKLDVANNKLSMLPPEVGLLVALRVLDVRNNKLEALPEELGACTALETLHAEQNQVAQLPESIGQLASLRTLNLRGNRLNTVPASLSKCRSLRTLDLRSNCLYKLPYDIGALRALTQLALQFNPDMVCPPTCAYPTMPEVRRESVLHNGAAHIADMHGETTANLVRAQMMYILYAK